MQRYHSKLNDTYKIAMLNICALLNTPLDDISMTETGRDKNAIIPYLQRQRGITNQTHACR